MASFYELCCRECGKRFPNQPLSACDECFSSLEVVYDLSEAKKTFTRERIAQGPQSMWRYQALLPVPNDFVPATPTGMTPLMAAPRLGKRIGATNLYIKNDAVCLPTLSFKDRVVSVALSKAREFGMRTVGCASERDVLGSGERRTRSRGDHGPQGQAQGEADPRAEAIERIEGVWEGAGQAAGRL